jgi:hypothetical protein
VDLLSDQRFVDLDANLHYFAEKYDPIFARHDEERDTMATVRGTPFHRVARFYDQYIHTQRDEVRAMEPVAAVSSEPSNPATAN